DLAAHEVDAAGVGVAVGRVRADHQDLALAHRGAHVELAVVAQRQVDVGVLHVAAHAAVEAGVGDDAAQRALAADADGDAVAVVLEEDVRQQQAGGQGAPEGGAGGGGGTVARDGAADELGGVGGHHTDAAVGRQSTDQVGHVRFLPPSAGRYGI